MGFGTVDVRVAFKRVTDRLREEEKEKQRAARLRLQAAAFRLTAKVAGSFQALTGQLPSEVNPEGASYVRAQLEDKSIRPATFLALPGPLGVQAQQPPPIPTPQENLEQLGFGAAPVPTPTPLPPQAAPTPTATPPDPNAHLAFQQNLIDKGITQEDLDALGVQLPPEAFPPAVQPPSQLAALNQAFGGQAQDFFQGVSPFGPQGPQQVPDPQALRDIAFASESQGITPQQFGTLPEPGQEAILQGNLLEQALDVPQPGAVPGGINLGAQQRLEAFQNRVSPPPSPLELLSSFIPDPLKQLGALGLRGLEFSEDEFGNRIAGGLAALGETTPAGNLLLRGLQKTPILDKLPSEHLREAIDERGLIGGISQGTREAGRDIPGAKFVADPLNIVGAGTVGAVVKGPAKLVKAGKQVLTLGQRSRAASLRAAEEGLSVGARRPSAAFGVAEEVRVSELPVLLGPKSRAAAQAAERTSPAKFIDEEVGRFKKGLIQPDPPSKSPAAITAEEARRTAPDGTLFHGTGEQFRKFGEGRQDTTALFGPGVYLTDDAEIAASYARATRLKPATAARGRTRGTPNVELVQPVPGLRLINLEETAHPALLRALEKEVTPGGHTEDMVGAVVDAARKNPDMTGVEVFLSLRRNATGFITAEDFGEVQLSIVERLIDDGFDGFTHIGGIGGGRKHKVTIIFDPDKARVVSAEPFPIGIARAELETPGKVAALREAAEANLPSPTRFDAPRRAEELAALQPDTFVGRERARSLRLEATSIRAAGDDIPPPSRRTRSLVSLQDTPTRAEAVSGPARPEPPPVRAGDVRAVGAEARTAQVAKDFATDDNIVRLLDKPLRELSDAELLRLRLEGETWLLSGSPRINSSGDRLMDVTIDEMTRRGLKPSTSMDDLAKRIRTADTTSPSAAQPPPVRAAAPGVVEEIGEQARRAAQLGPEPVVRQADEVAVPATRTADRVRTEVTQHMDRIETLVREGGREAEVKAERSLMANLEGEAKVVLTRPSQKKLEEGLRRLRGIQDRSDAPVASKRRAFEAERKLLDEMSCGL